MVSELGWWKKVVVMAGVVAFLAKTEVSGELAYGSQKTMQRDSVLEEYWKWQQFLKNAGVKEK